MITALYVMIIFSGVLVVIIFRLETKLARMTGQRDGWLKNYEDASKDRRDRERIIYLQERKIKQLSQLLVDVKPIEPVLVDKKINKLVD